MLPGGVFRAAQNRGNLRSHSALENAPVAGFIVQS